MEDKKIDQALLWLQIFVVIVLVLLLYAYFSLPVHAAEITTVQTYYYDQYYDLPTEKYSEVHFSFTTSKSGIVGISSNMHDDYYTIQIREYDEKDKMFYSLSDSTTTWHTKMINYKYPDSSYEDDNVKNHFLTSFDYGSYETDKDGLMTVSYKANFPVFDTYAHALAYVQTGDTTGILNGITLDDPDFQDTAYAFTGFTANNKMTATWTGTTERSYLKDEEVEEYVRVSYGFADKDAPDSIKQVDNDTTEYATADKSLTVDVSALVPDDDSWFLRYVQVIPCYRQAGLGVWGNFYHGIPNVIYFNKDGSIEKIIQKTKPTDLNKGNMVYDSSIGYLQNVIYTEQKTHDGTGRQATFKWSTQKSLPSDAQVEIVAQNFYVQWFNKKTEENFVFKEYGEDCFYSAGSYSFNSQTPVWTWLKEKEIDPFSFKTQSYGSTEYYLRIVTYSDSDSLYHYGGWVKVNIKEKTATRVPSTDVETGGFDESSGLWNQDTESDDSYHYSTDDEGKLTGNIDVNSWEDLNMNSFTWMYRNMQSMVSSLGEFPTMVNSVFGYLPVQYITAIGVLLVAIVLLRFLGR